MTFGSKHIGIFVAAVCYDSEGNFLMGKRGGKARDRHGRWEFPGGTVEWGETLESALKREITEECGSEPYDLEQVRVKEYHTADQHYLGVYYIAKIDRTAVYIAEPVYDEIGWFTPETLPDQIDHDTKAQIIEYTTHFDI